jgi:regulation of enolase protein 1 (concanavalin A-like superfamily)
MITSTAAANDNLSFVYTTITGNFTFIARLSNQLYQTGATLANVRSGLMLRAGITGPERFISIVQRATPEIRAELRKQDSIASGTTSLTTTTVSLANPTWYKMVRVGEVYSLYYSFDGTTWSTAKTYDYTSTGYTAFGTGSLYLGFVVESGNSGVLTGGSQFDNVTITQP